MATLEITTGVPTEIRMTRVFDAPAALVRRAMTEPDLVKRWLGNSRSPIVGIELDLRVGGRYRYTFRRPDGFEFSLSGVYRELTEARVVHTESMEGQPGEAVVTTSFAESAGRTTMVVVMAFPTQKMRDMVLATGMSDGAAESYDNLAALVSR